MILNEHQSQITHCSKIWRIRQTSNWTCNFTCTLTAAKKSAALFIMFLSSRYQDVQLSQRKYMTLIVAYENLVQLTPGYTTTDSVHYTTVTTVGDTAFKKLCNRWKPLLLLGHGTIKKYHYWIQPFDLEQFPLLLGSSNAVSRTVYYGCLSGNIPETAHYDVLTTNH